MMFSGLISILPCSDAVQIKMNGDDGKKYCATYETPSVGTPVIVKKCNPKDPNENSWTPTSTTPKKSFMGCLSQDLNICAGLDENNKMVLLTKNEADVSQHWIRKAKGYTNKKTGNSMCAEAVMSSSKPEVVMSKCNPSKKHQSNVNASNA